MTRRPRLGQGNVTLRAGEGTAARGLVDPATVAETSAASPASYTTCEKSVPDPAPKGWKRGVRRDPRATSKKRIADAHRERALGAEAFSSPKG